MSVYLIKSDTLLDIANAIREKTGDIYTIAVKDMAAQIADIQVGEPLFDYENHSITEISKNGFQDLTCLRSMSSTSLTKTGNYAFRNCTNLESVYLPAITGTSLGYGSFYGCTNLKNISLGNVNYLSGYTFYKCSSLLSIKLPLTNIYSRDFANCTNLQHIALTSSSVCTSTLTSLSTVFENTPIASGAGSIYVPNNLVDSYKTDALWSRFASIIKPMSEYTEPSA